MEREIRTWDKVNQVMRYYSLEGVLHDGSVIVFSDNPTYSYVDDHFSEDTQNYEIMWSTGLKDKNGVEVYEGDIVEITDTFHTYVVAIKWIDERCGWGFDIADPEEYGYLSEWTMEVKGNIYRNPELLK